MIGVCHEFPHQTVFFPYDAEKMDGLSLKMFHAALKAEGVTSRSDAQPRHCRDDAEDAISRNSSPRSNLHCEL